VTTKLILNINQNVEMHLTILENSGETRIIPHHIIEIKKCFESKCRYWLLFFLSKHWLFDLRQFNCNSKIVIFVVWFSPRQPSVLQIFYCPTLKWPLQFYMPVKQCKGLNFSREKKLNNMSKIVGILLLVGN